MTERFIGEAIQPEPGSGDATRATTGAPGLPARFTWRDEAYEVQAVLRTWREMGPCRHGSGEQYVRRHCFEVRTVSGSTMVLYFERQARSARDRKRRWWLRTMTDG